MLLFLFGIIMAAIGVLMIIRPQLFSNGIADFASKSWFHPFEIFSRLVVGILFIHFSENASFPLVFFYIGLLLCFVSIFLIIIGSERHKRFALLTSKIGKHFRPIGMFAVILGSVLAFVGYQ